MAVGIGIGEETGLEDRVGGGLDVGDEVGGRESDLLDFGKVVLDILVQDELANRAKRELAVRPDLGQVQNVVAEALGLLGSHGLL